MATSLLQHPPFSTRRSICSSNDSIHDRPTKADRILLSLRDRLHIVGFDVVEPLCIGWYNAATEDVQDSQIPVKHSAPGEKTLAVLVGNCKNMWSHLLENCRQSPSLLDSADPVDEFCEQAIQAATSAEQQRTRIYFSHEETAGKCGGGYVAMQRLAEVAGCAYNDSFSHLSLHPRYGPWFALRALIVFDGVEYHGQQMPKLPNPMSRQTESYVRTAVRSARTSSLADLMSCSPGSAVDEPLADAATDEATAEAMRKRWRKWVAVRDAPFPGHPWRYSEQMIMYHYTGAKSALLDAVNNVLPPRRLSLEEPCI